MNNKQHLKDQVINVVKFSEHLKINSHSLDLPSSQANQEPSNNLDMLIKFICTVISFQGVESLTKKIFLIWLYNIIRMQNFFKAKIKHS